MNCAAARTAVVHLVRHANGIEPFEQFLASYENHDAGCDHELVLLCKGFADRAQLAPLRRRATGRVALEVHVGDEGRDVTAYMAAARELTDHRRLCFVNSFATILAPGWLGLLCDALDAPGVGIAGATGSWASHRSFALAAMRLPNGYRGTLGDRGEMLAAFRSVSATPVHSGLIRRLVAAARGLPRELVGHPGFPAPHVRTNAFVIERELLLTLRGGRLASRSAAYRFEAGTNSLTAQLRSRALDALVVGRDGVARGSEVWPEADVFWQGAQRELLVADNQTRVYENGAPSVREALSRFAWGPHARPA